MTSNEVPMRPHTLPLFPIAAVVALSVACDNDYSPGPSGPTTAAPAKPLPVQHEISVPFGIPLTSKIIFDKQPVGDVVESEDKKRHVAKVVLPAEVELLKPDILQVQVPSPCGEALLPLVRPEKEEGDKSPETFFKVKDGHWDKIRIYVDKGAKAAPAIKIGKFALPAGKADGESHELFGLSCPEARKVFFDDKEVGELPEPVKKDETTSYLIAVDKAQTYCLRRTLYGAVGLDDRKSETYTNGHVHRLLSSVDFWMKDAPDKITTEGSAFQNEAKYALKSGACPP